LPKVGDFGACAGRRTVFNGLVLRVSWRRNWFLQSARDGINHLQSGLGFVTCGA